MIFDVRNTPTLLRQHSKKKTVSTHKKLLSQNQKLREYMLTNNNLLKNTAKTRVFEIKKLIETVAQELAFLSSITDESNLSIQYSLKIARYHMGSVKNQKLACCSYPSCLFNIRQKLWLDKQASKKSTKKIAPARTLTFHRSNNNVLKQRQKKQLSRTTFQQRVNAANNQRNITIVQKMQSSRVKPKRFTETATQTVPWEPESQPYSSSYQNSMRDISDNEEEDISESEEELYCKSDTLNDASMITEEIASEFAVAQSRVNQNGNEFSKSRKSLTVKESYSRSPTNRSSYLGSNLKTKIEAQDSANDSITFKTQKSVSNKKESSTNHSSEKENANKSSNKGTHSKSKAFYDVSRKLSDNIYLNRSHVVANPITRSKSLTPMRSNLIAEALKNLSSNKSLSKNSDKNTDPSLKRKNLSVKENSLKATSQNVDASETQPENTLDHKKEQFVEKGDKGLLESQDEKPLEFQNETENKENSLEYSNVATEQENGKMAGNEITNECLRVLSSSDNETTYFPIHSSSASGGLQEENSEGSSSIKENDNTSPEYSSHWTEEYSSTEVSEAEIDESFQEKFLTYKEALLEEDDGIVASSEDETPSSDEHQVTEILCNGEGDQKTLAQIICEGNIEEFREQLKMEENLTQIVDENGWNLLHLAAFKGFVDFIEELLNLGISIESTTKVGYTALHLAAANNHMKCVKTLLRHGASLYSEDVNKEVLPKITATSSSAMKCLLQKYQVNVGKVQAITHILNRFARNKKNLSNDLSKNLLQTLADITLDEESTENVSSSDE
ncbi:ANK_REP_REGION domain-containing protein [Trichonephila clavata]|uniref:ANK_REP_REGION domain-containing protein n=1 Tax=Trichonephila clavata TaxID=2740835 RepID=A0A8X6LPG4_TRICU|nr:ANK_REP_REGION domain-containing protein [Trichonephila clavata]